MNFDERKNAKNLIAEGGEGRLYKTGTGTLVKIFKKMTRKQEKEKKLRILAAKKLPETIVAPIDTVTTPSGTFSGYEMPMIHGDEIRVLSSVRFVRANHVTKKDIVFMLVQIKNTLKMIHTQGLIIGDLNDSNILFDNQYNVHFIDVDSWKISPYNCDVVMDAFKDPSLHGNDFTADTDAYAFAILAYKALTRLHPFGGTIKKGNDIDLVSRMKMKLSAINNHDIIRPMIVDDDAFMPTELLASFKKIFESNSRFLIDAELDEFQQNMKLCNKHDDYYYARFMACPVCVAGAVEAAVIIPVITKTSKVQIEIIFKNARAIIIDENSYIIDGMVHFRNSGIVVSYNRGIWYYATQKGDAIFQSLADKIIITSSTGETTIPTRYKSPCVARGDSVYFVSPGLFLTRARVVGKDIAEEPIEQVSFNSYIGVDDTKTYIVFNAYDENKIISISGMQISLQMPGKMEDVSMHFDAVKKRWLLIVNDGKKTETMVIDSVKGIVSSNDWVKYDCPLARCDFNNGFIYMPGDGKITRADPATGALKVFSIPGITTDTSIHKTGAAFVATDISSIRKIGE